MLLVLARSVKLQYILCTSTSCTCEYSIYNLYVVSCNPIGNQYVAD
jgi:hypothetical protein